MQVFELLRANRSHISKKCMSRRKNERGGRAGLGGGGQRGRAGLAGSAAAAAAAPPGGGRDGLVAHGLQHEHHDGEDRDNDHDEPGQRGPEATVGVGAHDVTVVGNAHHEDEKDRQ